MSISEEKRKIIQESRRKQILDAAILLFDQQGFSATKISDISEQAGISKGLVYRYFNSKEEILLSDPVCQRRDHDICHASAVLSVL